MKKKLIYMSFTFLLALFITGCETDNYDAPNASFGGEVISVVTGKSLYSEQPNGFRIKWTELSWKHSENIRPEYFWGMPDGRFNWLYAFGYKGSVYELVPEQGAFVTPEPQQFTLQAKGDVRLRFEVIPYIHIDWSYQLNGETLNVKFTAVRPEGSTDDNLYALSTTRVLISNLTHYVGAMNTGGYVNDLSPRVSMTEAMLGTEQSVDIELESGQTYYVRVGVQTRNPANAYNYTEIAEIKVP